MQPLAERDYFTDHSILKDPYAYFEAIREKGPVYRLPGQDVVVVTGFQEAVEVLHNNKDFSSAIAPQGPVAPLPFEPKGSNLTAQIEEHRDEFYGGTLVVAYDDLKHQFSRGLLSRLFAPARLKANQDFIEQFAKQTVAEAVSKGGCELVNEISTPFVTLIVADLLGVPEDGRKIFMDAIAAGPPPGSLSKDNELHENHPLVVMGTYFAQYVAERREQPRNDILSELANASYPDGSTPEMLEIVKLATFLFGAGQDTSAKLLGNAMRYIVDVPGLQDQLRAQPGLIPDLLEEVLRLEGSTKMTSRLARTNTRIGDFSIPIGTRIFLALAAANRDPRRWDNPHEFVMSRPRIREHLAFGKGPHICIGAPLARVEVRIILEQFLNQTSHIDLDEVIHGPHGDRRFDFDASFIIRGLSSLHVTLAGR